jgi:hypothetical protein
VQWRDIGILVSQNFVVQLGFYGQNLSSSSSAAAAPAVATAIRAGSVFMDVGSSIFSLVVLNFFCHLECINILTFNLIFMI